MRGRLSLLNAADDTLTGSLSNRLRAKRFADFERFTAALPRPLRVLDIGGTVDYWEARGWAGRDDVELVLLNLTGGACQYGNITLVAGDACDITDFPDGAFHVAFSNSVIEHVGTPERQAMMAREVARVADRYWVQTPAFTFPMEPHYLIPGWQWLPRPVRVRVLQHRNVGQLGRTPDRASAERVIDGTRLLTRRQLRRMFPDAEIRAERLGLVKSWTAVH